MRVSVFAKRRKRKRAYQSRAFLNGVEVSHLCQIADTTVGRVRLLQHNAEGRPFVDERTGRVVVEWKHGRVEVRRT